MKRISKQILAAAICTVMLTGTGGILAWAGRQFEFFEDRDGLSIAYRNASEGEPWVQALSEEIGIRLDPALGKHDVRMALIGMDTCQVAGVDVPAFEVAIEVRPESVKFAMLTDEISATMLGQFRWRGTTSYPGEEEPGQAVYLYSSDAGVWFEKMEDFFILTSGGSIPPLMLGMPSGGYFGRVDLCQLWGTANLALLTSDTVRAQLDLYRDNKPWAAWASCIRTDSINRDR